MGRCPPSLAIRDSSTETQAEAGRLVRTEVWWCWVLAAVRRDDVCRHSTALISRKPSWKVFTALEMRGHFLYLETMLMGLWVNRKASPQTMARKCQCWSDSSQICLLGSAPEAIQERFQEASAMGHTYNPSGRVRQEESKLRPVWTTQWNLVSK